MDGGLSKCLGGRVRVTLHPSHHVVDFVCRWASPSTHRHLEYCMCASLNLIKAFFFFFFF
jgi:hypothetical protein